LVIKIWSHSGLISLIILNGFQGLLYLVSLLLEIDIINKLQNCLEKKTCDNLFHSAYGSQILNTAYKFSGVVKVVQLNFPHVWLNANTRFMFVLSNHDIY